MLFLDFDKASRRQIRTKDAESMLWRLARYVAKMQRQGELRVDDLEKALFLRTYERLSGRPVAEKMQRNWERKNYMHSIGWWIESLFYGGAQ
jgi:hypothetical protein